jgi:hypothetical protein
MNENEIRFFEEYKKLDNLCRDLLSSEKGVTSYIEEMDNTPLSKQLLVSDFDETYKMLKHVRWVRNDIAHGNGNSECEQADIDFVCDFYKKILSRTDPFAIIRKAENEAAKKAAKKKAVQTVQRPVYIERTPHTYYAETNNDYNTPKKNNPLPLLVIIAIILLLLALVIWSMIN